MAEVERGVRAGWPAPVARPRRPGRWDLVLAGAVVVASLVEALARPGVAGAVVPAGVTVALALAVARTQPLAATVIGFGAPALLDGLATLAGRGPVEVWTAGLVVLLPAALARWGRRRELGVGAGVVLLAWVLAVALPVRSAGEDVVGGLVVLLLSAAVGTALRYRDAARRSLLEAVRADERAHLAHELHDSVGHHVAAITVQAQAGAAVARAGGDDRSAVSFAAIEGEAVRALHEMRTMVSALAGRACPAGLASLTDLASDGPPRVEVVLQGDVDAVPAPVAASVRRIVQESVTNARRHAPGASTVRVVAAVGEHAVEVSVHDDGGTGGRQATGGTGSSGRATRVPVPGGGLGIPGMRERAELHGGTLTAGRDDDDGGWLVRAHVPTGAGRR